ncbi:MAG: superoxide dismutase [Candidatus Neomarinimicrobiota bacterium]
MKIIAIEKELPGARPGEFRRLGRAEALTAWQLHQDDFIRELYFKADEDLAVLILEAETLEDARSQLAELPFVKNGLIDFELLPLRPYPGFERLFNK